MEKSPMMYIQKKLNFDTPPSPEVAHVAEQSCKPPPADQRGQASPLAKHASSLPETDRVPSQSTPVTPAAILHFLRQHSGEEFSAHYLRHQFACTYFDPANPLENPVHKALKELKEAGKAHVVEPRWGEPRFSVLELPKSAAELTLSHCPQSLSGPEIRRLFTRHKHTIAEFAKNFGFTQKHVRKVFNQGLDHQNAVRDWLEAILTPVTVAASTTTTAAPPPPVAAIVPYTFEAFKKFHGEFSKGPVSFEAYQAEFQRLWDSQESVKAELIARYKAKELTLLAGRMRGFVRNGQTKDENAQSILHAMLKYFVLDNSVSYSPFSGETYESALKKKVEALTAGEYYRHFEKKHDESLAKEAALADPKNLADFRLLIETKGEDTLTDEQLGRYDAMQADLTRDLRAQQSATSTVERFQSDELHSLSFVRKEGYHDKRHCPLYVVQLESRVERDAFNELNRKAKQLGGWYSSFKKDDAGFQFLVKDQADRFCELLAGDVNRSDVLEHRKERREVSAAERLHELAKNLMERAEETIERSNASLQNTARRAGIQAGVRGQAYADQAMSRTIHSLAEALSRGEAKYLDGIRHKSQLQTLDAVLSLAKWKRIRAVKQQASESTYSHERRQDCIEEEPISLATIRFVEFPYPTLYRRNLEDAITRGRNASGVKKSAESLRKYLGKNSDDYTEFSRQHELECLFEFVDRAKAQGIDVERISEACENYKRLVRANITSLPELRAALREYLEHRAERRGDDPVRIAERELIGKDLPGFFPTPRPVIERMLELADLQPQHRVLEPSCGKGDILDALKDEHPGIELVAIERNWTLEDVLSAKGHQVEFADFLEHAGSYDRILMNPPFEDGLDIEHIQHAYSLLSPGGRLVSVLCEGPFFRFDKKSVAFRQWLDGLGGETEQLPEDAFAGRDAFRQTGVRTRLITIIK